MRPTDENQPASTRPNLMSPRRTSGEDSILAMLERDPARKRSKAGAHSSGGRLVWYGASAAVALALTGTLAWLAAGNQATAPDGSELHVEEALTAEAKPMQQHAAPAARSAPALPLPAPQVRQVAMAGRNDAPLRAASPAVIVDQAPPADAVPPLRLLKPAPANEAAPVLVPVPAARTSTPRPSVRTAPPAARVAATSALEPRLAARPAARPAPATAPAAARARPALATRTAPRPAQAKPQRTVNPARSGEQHVDADVALISAVIVHANGHAPQGSQMTELLCPNDSCKEKPARQ